MLTILFYHDFLFLKHFLIAVVIAQIFNFVAELVIPIGIPTKETKSEMERYTVIAEAKTRKCSI